GAEPRRGPRRGGAKARRHRLRTRLSPRHEGLPGHERDLPRVFLQGPRRPNVSDADCRHREKGHPSTGVLHRGTDPVAPWWTHPSIRPALKKTRYRARRWLSGKERGGGTAEESELALEQTPPRTRQSAARSGPTAKDSSCVRAHGSKGQPSGA